MHLFLEDLSDMTEEEVKHHISEEYAGEDSGFYYGSPSDDDKKKVADYLNDYDIIVAYESVGSWGCDSASYFLIKNKTTGEFQEFSGSHCSCFGFEGQFEPESTDIEYLKSDRFNFYCGEYDENETENQKSVREFLKKL